ncbi:MAG: hypothetical protein ACFBSC_19590 [Microcoleaceae cyanobacterium]
MARSKWFRSSTALTLTLGLLLTSAASLVTNTSVNAQAFPESLQRRDRISAGTFIPVIYEDAERIVVTPDETVDITVQVAQTLRTNSGRIWLPAGSEINGQVRPVYGGSQFVAEEVVFEDGRSFRLNADSDVVSRTERIRRGASAGDILKGAAIGAAAATAVAAITGDTAIATEEVLGGAGLGAIAGVFLGRDEVEVVVIQPEDLDLRLASDIVFR